MSDAVGSELWCLIRHVTKRHNDVALATDELALRTRCSPAESASGVRSIENTPWFRTMASRFSDLQNTLGQKSSAGEEAREVIGGMYANGAEWSNLPSTLVTVTSMMTEARIDDNVLMEQGKKHASGKSGRASKDDLIRVFLTILSQAAIPERWWETDDYAKASIPILHRVGLSIYYEKKKSPCILLEYAPCDGATLRHRVVALGKSFTESSSVTPFAKKLHRSYHALLKEDQITKYLLRLQRLMKQAKVMKAETEAAAKTAASQPVAPPAPTSATPAQRAPSGPKKADIGLLYRDPEAALKDVDLQDADDLTVKEYKAKMDDAFKANIVRPGDAGYQYDIRKEVKPSKKSEWDSDSD